MDYAEWEAQVPKAITADSLWKMKAYRVGLWLGDLGWFDVTKLAQDQRTIALSNQLYRSLGSISVNLAEGYSMGTGKNRARYYEYSLGSARESRDWYWKGRKVLGDTVIGHRMRVLEEIIRLLLTMIPQQRDNLARESGIEYEIKPSDPASEPDINLNQIQDLLRNVPLP